jgi:magnesium transporter
MAEMDDATKQADAAADASRRAALVKTVACIGGVSLERGVPAEEIHEYISDPGNLVWMDVQDPGPAELSTLLEEFGFHPLALQDVTQGQQRPKVDEYKGYLFVVVYGVVSAKDTRELRTLEVDLFIGRNYVVSIHRERLPALEDALARWTRGGTMLREGVGFLVYTVVDAIIDAYFPLLDAIEDEVDETELAMFERQDEECTLRLLRLKRTLVSLRRVLHPLRDIFGAFLRRDHAYFSASTAVYFQDVYNHVLRIVDVVDIERDMVTGALEAYLAVVSNRVNKTMKALAVCTIAVAFISAVFGAYGMNFKEIPLAEEPWGFWAIAGGTSAMIAGFLYYSWRRRGL